MQRIKEKIGRMKVGTTSIPPLCETGSEMVHLEEKKGEIKEKIEA